MSRPYDEVEHRVPPPQSATRADGTDSRTFSVGSLGTKTIDFGVEITEHHHAAIVSALDSVERLRPPLHARLVERNHRDLESLHRFATLTMSLGRAYANPDHHLLAESVLSSAANWLSSFRLYLDHEETDLKRRHGKRSAEIEAFKAATHAAFDDHPGYRFTYKFRNYVQHCGFPPVTLQVGRSAVPSPVAVQQADLVLDRDLLLKNYDEWGAVRSDLEAAVPRFGLLPLAEDAMDGLALVFTACAEIYLDHAVANADVLGDALDRIEAAGCEGAPVVCAWVGDAKEPGFQIGPRPIPAEAVRALQRVASGEVPKESLWAEPSGPPPPPPLDPANIQAQFHRSSRGVQALTARLAETGPTPELIRTINEMIQVDGSPEPLLSGLIDVSTLLAHMTAGVLGTTAQALVSGLLDMYPAQGLLPVNSSASTADPSGGARP